MSKKTKRENDCLSLDQNALHKFHRACHSQYISDTLQCIAEMLRITKQATGLDLLVMEKRLER